MLIFFVSHSIIKESFTVVLFKKLLVDLPFPLQEIPFIVYLIFLILLYSGFFYLYLAFKKRKQDKKLRKSLKMLNEGHYSADIFLKMFSQETPIQISPSIDQEFLKLQEKLMLISERAVNTAQQESRFVGDSKEKIIETERKRIARELHDSVSQQLFAAAMILSALESERNEMDGKTDQKINLISSILGEAQSEMRALLLHLRPVKLDGKSLKQSIENLFEELNSKVPLEINYEIDDIKLTEIVENHLFRIIQELLSNVLRHSEANSLEVYLKETKDFYRLRFIDDGKGFDIKQNKNNISGLSNIKERIEGFGGNFKIISFPEEGTSVEIRIPLITRRII